MSTSARQAGDSAVPFTAICRPPVYQVHAWLQDAYPIECTPSSAHGEIPATVTLRQGAGGLNFHHSMTPKQARQLAVYLVDCANALDNPAARVIVDAGEGIGHE